MKQTFPEEYRVQILPYVSKTGDRYGIFIVPYKSFKLRIMAVDGKDTGWEHVSVSLKNRTPNWDEMCFIKSLFWDDEETVIQFHPPKSEYVNNHPNCLHLWRHVTNEIELPPSILVGIK
jgi:hypothetical protein